MLTSTLLESPGSMPAPPASPGRSQRVLDHLPGQHNPQQIGAFRILEELGSGGMGTVFLATQTEPVERTVALKVMRSHYLDEVGRVRFETERQAMARLQHPFVAQIFEAGTTDEGQPYFVMERVEGLPITDYCDHHRLSVQERLRLFRDVCEGVHHAHQKGIIHRDLKPSNILVTRVDRRHVPKIIDFGIAKTFGHAARKGDADLEVTGERLLGTPAYLSPEAAHLREDRVDLDTRSDVYSLGILLYELLAGRRPFHDSEANLYQVLHQIAMEEPSGPSTSWNGLGEDQRRRIAERRHIDTAGLGRQLRGDLDWIVLKAIAKRRSDRYDSASALAADVDRHLRHEPVVAGPPSTFYRVRKFVRRRAGTVAAVLAIVLALGAGLVARTQEARRANREKAAAIAAREETETALEVAEKARAESAEVSQFLVDLFRLSDPGQAKGGTVTARELLAEGAAKVRTGFEGQPQARARFMQRIADIYRKLGLYDEALELAKEGLALRREHLPPRHLELAESLNGLATLYAQLGRFEDAEPLLREALDIRRERLPPDDLFLATTINNLANLMIDLGQPEEAEPLFVQAIEIGRRQDGKPLEDQLVALNNLAAHYADTGRHAEADPLLREFVAHMRAEHGDLHPYVAFALENLADVRWHLGAGDKAERLYLEAEEILVEVFGSEHPEVAYCLGERAHLYARQGRLDEAEPLFRRALTLQEASLPDTHPELLTTRERMAEWGF